MTRPIVESETPSRKHFLPLFNFKIIILRNLLPVEAKIIFKDLCLSKFDAEKT